MHLSADSALTVRTLQCDEWHVDRRQCAPWQLHVLWCLCGVGEGLCGVGHGLEEAGPRRWGRAGALKQARGQEVTAGAWLGCNVLVHLQARAHTQTHTREYRTSTFSLTSCRCCQIRAHGHAVNSVVHAKQARVLGMYVCVHVTRDLPAWLQSWLRGCASTAAAPCVLRA